MVEARKHTYILEEYLGIGGPDQGVLDMKGVKVTDITDEEILYTKWLNENDILIEVWQLKGCRKAE